MTDREIKLLPCPFCGGTVTMRPEGRSPGYWVQCDECKAQSDDMSDRDSAASIWNERIHPASTHDTMPSLDDLRNDSNRTHELLYALRHANDGFALSVLKDGSWVVWKPLDAKYAAAAEPDEYLVTIPLPELATVTQSDGATTSAEASNAAALKASDERTTGEDASLSLAPAETARVFPASTHDTMRAALREARDLIGKTPAGALGFWAPYDDYYALLERIDAALSPQPQVTEEEIAALIAEHVQPTEATIKAADGVAAIEGVNEAARAIHARLTGSAK